ncbi:MAG: CDP-glucose 4,6-dehydratase [Candidatus Gastranaerophilales bacterium]|nr:CDP-glucose 4,6-dehydratase [Candidatus Gastranaerophilales bacterium]
MKEYFNGIFNGKTVLISGHTGFKGSWLAFWLKNMGANVIGYALEPKHEYDLFNCLDLKNQITHIIGDVADKKNLLKVFKKYQPEFVFHMAAQPLVRYSYIYPEMTYKTNVFGTINMFEVIKEVDCAKVFVNITSDKCYENKEINYLYKETDSLGGYDPYSSSKAMAEILTSSYRNSYFNPKHYGEKHNTAIASVRAGNVIGGGDWSEGRLLPDCIKSLLNQEYITIRYPHATRPWQFVLEPLGGYLLLASYMYQNGKSFNEGWNFGPLKNEVATVEQIVRKTIKIWGDGGYRIDAKETWHESNLLQLDITKAATHLKWQPVYSIDEALNEAVSWYKTLQEKKDIQEFTLNQIINFAQKASYIEEKRVLDQCNLF